MRQAYIICAQWPVGELSRLGQLSWYLIGGGDGHVGLFFPYCSAEERRAHTGDAVVARHDVNEMVDHVCFDYLYNQKPRFHTLMNTEYWGTRGFYTLHPVNPQLVSFEALHRTCLRVARLQPVNQWWYRWPALVGGVVCCPGTEVDEGVAPCSCGGLVLRIVAAAMTESDAPLRDDGAALRALGIDRWSLHAPFSPYSLTGYTPRMALEALVAARVRGKRVLEDLVVGFDGAIAQQRRHAMAMPLPSMQTACGA